MVDKKANEILHIDVHHKHQDWNQYLEEFESKNIFQSYEWGELKKSEGWQVFRILITSQLRGNPISILLAQVLLKTVFGIKIAWCPGGPLLQTSSLEKLEFALKKFTEKIFLEKIFNLRCNPYIKNTKENKKIFTSFFKPKHTLTRPKTIIMDIKPEEEFLGSVKKKHRYYIKQSQKHDISWKLHHGPNASQTFLVVYEQMIKNKNLNYDLIDIGCFAELLGFTKNGDPRVFCLAGFKNDEPLAACIISLLSNKAFYHYAASTEEGREIFVSYGMIFELMKQLKKMGIKEMDFGGISDDDLDGVDFFKSGFNGKTFEKIGEFDVSKLELQSYLFSKAVQFKYKK